MFSLHRQILGLHNYHLFQQSAWEELSCPAEAKALNHARNSLFLADKVDYLWQEVPNRTIKVVYTHFKNCQVRVLDF